MKEFVYAPSVLFYSLSFMYQNAFFIGTRQFLYVCPELKDKEAQIATGEIVNQIEGKKADVFLGNLVKEPGLTAQHIHELFTKAIAENNQSGFNNIACINLAEVKRIRLNSGWFETSIAVGYKENLLGEKFMIGSFGKAYKKDIASFYLQFYKPNRMLKAEENFL